MKAKKSSIASLLVVLLCLVLVTGVGATDFYMLQTSDTHYTGGMISNGSRATVQAMNNMPGMAWPYGTIGTPQGAIVCGDLCDGGCNSSTPATDTPQWYSNRNYQNQWNGFDYNFPIYGVQGDNNRLRYPTYAVGGNHDYWRWCGYTLGTSTYVANKLYTRYGGGVTGEGNNYYSFTTNGIHFVALGRYPDSTVLSWLASDLAGVGTSTPVVLFLHYDFMGSDEWWTSAQRQALANTISGYRIIAILHGHTHGNSHYTWNGYDVYNDGTATYYGGINVLHITDSELEVAHYYAYVAGGAPEGTDGLGYWDGGAFEWSYSKEYNPQQFPPSPPDPGAGTHIQYVGHVQNIGWQDWVQDGATAGTTGQGLQVEALAISSLNTNVYYRAHIQWDGWQDWRQNGDVAGTTGLGRKVEAVQITVDPGYSVSYQAHVQDIGWMGIVSDGQTAGTTGQNKRIEALRIWITKL